MAAAVFYARLNHWERVPGGEILSDTALWIFGRLCALAEYKSLFKVDEGDQLLVLYEAEDLHMGRLFGMAHAEVFTSHGPLLATDPSVFLPGLHA